MKHLATIFALLAIVFFSTKDNAYTFSAGGPEGRTGSPGDGDLSCTSYCHTGPVAGSGENIVVSVTQPLDQGPYRISIEVSNTGGVQYEKAGFQACVEDASGAKIGELSTVSNALTQIVAQDYITHTLLGTAPSTASPNSNHVWEFDWTPPANFDGEEATIYAASMLTNNNGTNSGDVHLMTNYTFNVGLALDEADAIDFSVYPNPAEDVIHISFEEVPEEDIAIALYDLKGAEVVLFEGKYTQKEHSMIIPLGLAKGVYTLSVHSNHRQSSQKLLIR